jgi:L-threonylcarbamoyladenylate synthase
MKYRHYAPRGTVILVEGEPAAQVLAIRELARRHAPRRVVVLAAEENVCAYPGLTVVSYGPRRDLREVARRLFEALRRCDELGAEVVLAEGTERRGLGLAVSDRLRRAAAQVVHAPEGV